MPSLATFFSIVALGLLVLVGPRLLRGVRAPARRHVARAGGALVMRSPARYGIALGVSALVPAAVLGGIAVRLAQDGRTGPGGVALVVVAAAAAVAVALHQFVAAARQGFVVDELGITRVGVLTRQRVRWADVSRFVYNPASRWFFATLADGSHLWVPVETHGIADFAAIALERLPPAALRADELARDALEELAASGDAGQ